MVPLSHTDPYRLEGATFAYRLAASRDYTGDSHLKTLEMSIKTMDES